jgi:hypothetical protein
MANINDQFPEIADLAVRVFSQRGGRIPRDKPRQFGRDVPEYAECANPRCSSRFRLWPLIRMAVSQREPMFSKRQACSGFEPRKQPCLYTFEIEGDITYRDLANHSS